MASDVSDPDASNAFGGEIQGSRSEQQDSFRLRWLEGEKAWLIVLADGMGGHAGGGQASKLAVESFTSAFLSQRGRSVGLEEALQASLSAANSRIAQAQKSRPELADMGTTMVAAHVSTAGVAWISVGDSPMWVLRGGRLHRLNEDHSMRGLPGSPKSMGNMLQSVLNGQPIPMVDCRAAPVALKSEDMLLVASDGILTLSDDEIAKIINHFAASGAETVTRALLIGVSQARKANQDNCTIVAAFPPLTGAADAVEQSAPRRFAAFDLNSVLPVALSALAGFASVMGIFFAFAH